MNPRRPLRGPAAAILAICVVAVGLSGVSSASAAVDPSVQEQVSVHGNPTAVAITPNSATIIVTTSTERLSFIDPVLRYVTNSSMTCDTPNDVAVSPDGSSIYVACAEEVWEHSFADPDATDSFSLPGGVAPKRIAITPDGTRAYIADSAGWQLIVVDLDTRATITTIAFANGDPARDLAISPDGKWAITVSGDGYIDQFNIDPNSPDYNTLVRSDASAPGMNGVVFSPDSTRAYIALHADGNNQVEVCEVGTFCGFNDSFAPRGAPWAVAISPDGNTLYTANNQGTVSIINTVDPDIGDNYDLINDNDPVTAIAAAANDKYLVAAQYDDGITIVGTTVAMKPSRPTALRATAGDGSISVSFTPGSDGGSPITKYQYRLNNGSWTDAAETTSPISITGLTNYTKYRIQLRAVNDVGTSRISSPVRARPRYTGPVLDAVTATGSTSVKADFSGVLFGGVDQSRYTVFVFDGLDNLAGSCRTKAASRSCSVTGLSADTDYSVSVLNYFRFPSESILRRTLASNTVTVRTNS